MSSNKKDNVHLKLSEELEGIDAELSNAMDALSATNERIDSYLNDGAEIPARDAAELDETDAEVEKPDFEGDTEL